MISDEQLGFYMVSSTPIEARKEMTMATVILVKILTPQLQNSLTAVACPHYSVQPKLTLQHCLPLQNWLGILLMCVIVGYHYVIADPKLSQA